VAKVQNSEKIIGGYNPLFWDSSNTYKSTNNSFIFSFADRNNLQNANIGYCKNNNQFGICCNSNCGPAFGSGYDLCFNYKKNWYLNYGNPNKSYPKIDDIQLYPEYFNINEYEVFQVVKM